MVVGNHNFINEMIQINGFQNIFSNKQRYPIIQLHELQQADYVFLSSEPFPFNEKQAKEIKKYTNAKIVFVDGEMFSWYGTRLLKALDYFLNLHRYILL